MLTMKDFLLFRLCIFQYTWSIFSHSFLPDQEVQALFQDASTSHISRHDCVDFQRERRRLPVIQISLTNALFTMPHPLLWIVFLVAAPQSSQPVFHVSVFLTVYTVLVENPSTPKLTM